MNEVQRYVPLSKAEQALMRVVESMKDDRDLTVRAQVREFEGLVRSKAIKICELTNQQYDKSGKPVNHATLGFDRETSRVISINVPKGFVDSPDIKSWGVVRVQIRDYVGIISGRNAKV